MKFARPVEWFSEMRFFSADLYCRFESAAHDNSYEFSALNCEDR